MAQRSERPSPVALITGASAGIGRALAERFAAGGFDLVLTARRLERLDALAAELQQRHGRSALTIRQDLAEPAAPQRIADAVAESGQQVDALVNNAGFSLSSGFLDSSWEQQAAVMQVMNTAPVQLCHLFAPAMVERGRGWILNVSSVAAFAPAMEGNLYTAAKAFLLDFSLSSALELEPRGVHCTALCPGMTRSEFHDVMGVRDSVDRLPAVAWTSAEQVAREGFAALMAGERFRIPGKLNQAFGALMKHLPLRWSSQLGKRQRTGV